MGTNGPKYDVKADLAKKSVSQLQKELSRFETGLSTNRHRGQVDFYVKHIARLKLEIAERIGKKHS